jgi:hypothetical protein
MILMTSGWGIGIIKPRDCATTLGDENGDESCMTEAGNREIITVIIL